MTTLRIDPAAQLPPYEQLRRQVIGQITAGHLAPETKLPAVRRLAADLGIAPGTVARAYKELEAEGYLIGKGRHGTIVAPTALQDPATDIQRLTQGYITAMQQRGLDGPEILDAVQHALDASTT